MKQTGISFLEILVVVAILGIVASFVAPNYTGWRSKANLASEYQALVSNIDYIKTRTRVINGTATLSCVSPTRLTYQISTTPQNGTSTVNPNFTSTIVEDNNTANLLSGNSVVVSTLCNNLRGIFLSNGQAGIEGSGNQIDIELNTGDRTRGAYRITVNQTTGFIQKYRWSGANNSWQEQD